MLDLLITFRIISLTSHSMYTNPERSCKFSLLHFACDGGLVDAVTTMLRLGIVRDSLDSNNKTPQVCFTRIYCR